MEQNSGFRNNPSSAILMVNNKAAMNIQKGNNGLCCKWFEDT